jgi:hypothetical protein
MKGNNFFWVSFADLMTSLFFILLVLFGLTVYDFKIKEKAFDEIKNIQESVKKLPREFFEYQELYKRHKLKKQIHFKELSSLLSPSDMVYLEKVGRSLDSTIQKFQTNTNSNKINIKYLLIIEGMSSSDSYKKNFNLSYERAFAVYFLWRLKLPNSIIFNPKYCEIQISGSGIRGIGRDKFNEENNQQILIHIIPKFDINNIIK